MVTVGKTRGSLDFRVECVVQENKFERILFQNYSLYANTIKISFIFMIDIIKWKHILRSTFTDVLCDVMVWNASSAAIFLT